MPNFRRPCALLALCLGTALAVDWKALKPEGYVSDFAKVVDPESKNQLERYCARVEKQTGAQIALVTVRSLEGDPIEDAANTLFRAWGVGQKGSNEGILMLLATGDRRSRLEIGYGLEPLIPDGFAGSILRQMRPALRERYYGEALRSAAQTIGSTIAQAKGISLDTDLPRRISPHTRDSIPWPGLLVGLFLVFWVMRSASRRGGSGGFLTGMLLGNMMARGSWGGRGSGGFGGYDSSDSFGGFGGGDSGGAGASSDW